MTLCQELNLDWTQKFDSVGISYDMDRFHKITDSNIDKSIKEISKTAAIWQSRNLNPLW